MIRQFWKIIKSYNLTFKANAFSTIIWVEDENIFFDAIRKAYEELKKYKIILDIKISNTGPNPNYEIRSDEI